MYKDLNKKGRMNNHAEVGDRHDWHCCVWVLTRLQFFFSWSHEQPNSCLTGDTAAHGQEQWLFYQPVSGRWCPQQIHTPDYKHKCERWGRSPSLFMVYNLFTPYSDRKWKIRGGWADAIEVASAVPACKFDSTVGRKANLLTAFRGSLKVIIFMNILQNIKYQSLFMELLYFPVNITVYYYCYIYLSLFLKVVQYFLNLPLTVIISEKFVRNKTFRLKISIWV